MVCQFSKCHETIPKRRQASSGTFFSEPLSHLTTAEVFSLAPGFSPVAADVKSDKPFQRLFFFRPAKSQTKPLKRFLFYRIHNTRLKPCANEIRLSLR
jgi:hypothetical protein